jgi:hypothetical protein
MTLGLLANLASTLAVVVALIFGTLQVRQMIKTRSLFTAAELVRIIQTPEFTSSIRLVLTLPNAASPEKVYGDPEMAAAVLTISHFYESIGVLVYHRILPLHLVDDLMGGYVRQSWRKLSPAVLSRREELGVYFGEWMQWLAERMDEYPSPGKNSGAHVTHRDWKP